MKTLLYPKIYATIIKKERRDPVDSHPWADWLLVETDHKIRYWLMMRWKNGTKKSAHAKKGVRVKIYQRPGVPHHNFRFVGD